jgi:hypothetical protein
MLILTLINGTTKMKKYILKVLLKVQEQNRKTLQVMERRLPAYDNGGIVFFVPNTASPARRECGIRSL